MPVAQHITRRGGIYRLRCRVPSDLVPMVRRGEIHRTLATACPKEAKRRAIRLYGRIADIFEGLRRPSIFTCPPRPCRSRKIG